MITLLEVVFHERVKSVKTQENANVHIRRNVTRIKYLKGK